MRRLIRPRGAARRAASLGLTLIELLVGIAVMAVLASAAAPFFGDMVVNSRLREAGNLVLTETLMAQSEAIKRNTVVRVALNGSTVQVQDMTVPAAPVVLRTRTLVQSVVFQRILVQGQPEPAPGFDFGPEGRPAPFGTAISVDMAVGGQSCSADVRCPGLRVDAGGGVRLCGNHLESCP